MTVDDPSNSRDATGWRPLFWLALALLPGLALVGHHWQWPPPPGAGDYAQYLLHAKALVQGSPYGDIGYLYHPAASEVGPPMYPPGLPLTLVPLVAIFGVHSPAFQALMVASLVAFAWVAYRRLAMDAGGWASAIGVGFAVLALEANRGTAVPISDVGFAALFWATILAVDGARTWTWSRVALVTALGFSAIAYRLVGVVLVPALALYAILTWRHHRGRALVPAVAWSIAGVALLLGPLAGTRGGVSLSVDVSRILGRLPYSAQVYKYGLMHAVLYPFAWDRWNDVYHVVALAVAAAGTVMVLWTARRTLLTIAVLGYVALLLVVSVFDARYLWPFYPLFGAAVPVALHGGLARLTPMSPRLIRRVVASACAAIMVAALRTELLRPPPKPVVTSPDAVALFAWVREAHGHAPMRAVSNNPRVLTLETGVPAMANVSRTEPGHLAAYVERRITHLIVQRDDSECLQRIASRVPDLFPGRFVLEFENPTYRVYRILPGGAPGERDYQFLGGKERERYCSLP